MNISCFGLFNFSWSKCYSHAEKAQHQFEKKFESSLKTKVDLKLMANWKKSISACQAYLDEHPLKDSCPDSAYNTLNDRRDYIEKTWKRIRHYQQLADRPQLIYSSRRY